MRALLGGPTPASAGWASGPTSRGGTSLRSVRVAGSRATVNLGPKIMQGNNARDSTPAWCSSSTRPPAPRARGRPRSSSRAAPCSACSPASTPSIPLTRASLASPSAPVPAPVGPSTGNATPEVAALQTRLAALGFLPAEAVDGRLGPPHHGGRDRVPEVGAPRARRTGRRRHPGRPRHGRPAPAPAARRQPGRRVGAAARPPARPGRSRTTRSCARSTPPAGPRAPPTPPGSYSVFSKQVRSWSVPFQVWLPYASYFVGGIAFHEYPEVPVQPASHGCVRVTSFDARWLFDFLSVGTPVRVVSRS